MILSDGEIKELLEAGSIEIIPEPEESQYDTSSLDLRLGSTFFRYKPGLVEQSGLSLEVDPAAPDFNFPRIAKEVMEEIQPQEDGSIILEPDDLVFARTLEKIHLPNNSQVAARVEGRSRLARMGIGVHLTAPTVQLGFRGPLILEIKNYGQLKVKLTPGMVICQLVFELVLGLATKEIDTPFQDQESPMGRK